MWKPQLRLGNVFGFDYWPTTLLTFNKLTFSESLNMRTGSWPFLGCMTRIALVLPGNQRTWNRALQKIGQSLCMVYKISGWDRLTEELLIHSSKKFRVMFSFGGIRCTFVKPDWLTLNWRLSVRLQQLDSEDWSCCMQLRFPRMSSEGLIWTSTDPCS